MKLDFYSENTNKLLFTIFDSVKKRKSDMYRIHHHSEIEFGFICGGEGKYILEKETYDAKAGQLFLIRPDEQHCVPTIYTSELSSFNIYLSSYYLWNECSRYFDSDIQLLIGSMDIPHCFADKGQYIEKIAALCGDVTLNRGQIKLQMLNLINSVISDIKSSVGEYQLNNISYKHINEIQNVIQYIKSNLKENLSLDLLAKNANMSRSNFSAVFKQITGVSQYKYILLGRIELAVDFIRNTDRSMLEIAALCGFNNIAGFNRHFKCITNMTPSDYRASKQVKN